MTNSENVSLASNENDKLIDRVCRGVASNQEGQQLREYIADLQKRVDFAADALTVVERRRDQLKAERDALRGSHETLSVGCLSYWRHHENRCVRPRDHAGECYYVTPGRAIMENMDFKPPLPLVTDRMQGVDCPDCEDETPHQHAQKAGEDPKSLEHLTL